MRALGARAEVARMWSARVMALGLVLAQLLAMGGFRGVFTPTWYGFNGRLARTRNTGSDCARIARARVAWCLATVLAAREHAVAWRVTGRAVTIAALALARVSPAVLVEHTLAIAREGLGRARDFLGGFATSAFPWHNLRDKTTPPVTHTHCFSSTGSVGMAVALLLSHHIRVCVNDGHIYNRYKCTHGIMNYRDNR